MGHLETYFLNSGYIIKLMDENMKIDAHIHFTPPSLGENLAEFSEQEPYWGLLLTPDPVNHTEQGWATYNSTIAARSMNRAPRKSDLKRGIVLRSATPLQYMPNASSIES